jgi:glycosyltransferase involved in cell wall biosynthesis
MRVTVVICTYTLNRYEAFNDAIASVRAQTYEDVDIVLVSDGNEVVYEKMRSEYGDVDNMTLHCNSQVLGIGPSRNKGAELGTGDIVAFIDDDSTATENWIEELVWAFGQYDALSVGGRMIGDWVAGEPWFLPAEFHWLVGVAHPNFADSGEEVRNAFGSNYAFRRDVFLALSGFDDRVGRKGDEERQAHESEIGVRLQQEFGQGVIYHPDAVVAHKIFKYRTNINWLLRRSFMQGYSKRIFDQLHPDAAGNEGEYLRQLLFDNVPSRLQGLVRSPSVAKAVQLLMLFVFTATVGLGYLYGIVVIWLESESGFAHLFF